MVATATRAPRVCGNRACFRVSHCRWWREAAPAISRHRSIRNGASANDTSGSSPSAGEDIHANRCSFLANEKTV